jgi:hypothetical protein
MEETKTEEEYRQLKGEDWTASLVKVDGAWELQEIVVKFDWEDFVEYHKKELTETD